MIRISKLADYAVVILTAMNTDDALSAAILAGRTKLPEPTVAKILKILVKAHIIRSIRGAGGGYVLTQKPEEMALGDIIEAIDGPVMLTSCVDGAVPDCSAHGSCSVRGRWDGVNAAIRKALDDISLADMAVQPYKCGAITKIKEGVSHGCN